MSFLALTESTYYVLMALYQKPSFGTEIVDTIRELTNGRIIMGPGTLYTILSKFEKDRLIQEIAVEGRKRTYAITQDGKDAFLQELNRLKNLVELATAVMEDQHDN